MTLIHLLKGGGVERAEGLVDVANFVIWACRVPVVDYGPHPDPVAGEGFENYYVVV
ncbi:hypothetical protein IL992_37425 [Microbispora sp. NEAU-D428]|uniref:hypothetical protein n=1 Tax=Microbispora sitophila TaxID=2771537 RepID=UPI001865E91F|nr:hypothetical protein [Microbispora sitophila]MBE3014818.1 hypothetical protein [Microbispora sitophila]